jgi:hypothetical protein
MDSNIASVKNLLRQGHELNKYQLFTWFVLFWVGLGWLALILTLFGIFHTSILAVYVLSGAAVLVYLVAFNKSKIEFSHRFFIVFLLTLLAIFIFAFYTTPTIFSGRDQGSLSEAAIQLSQNHKLEFSFPAEKEFFKIYGSGQALNFPGFNYTTSGNLVTQFPLGYTSWLAAFYSVFGLNGFAIANAITFFIFLFSFYLLTRYYLRPSSSIVAFLLVITCFIFSWFFKFTLSENLALGLLWFGIYEFILFTQHRVEETDIDEKKGHGRFYLLASFLSLGLLSFARIEATAFLAVIILILLIKYRDWKYLIKVVIGHKLLYVLGVMIMVYIFNIAIDSQAYLNILKGLVGPFISYGNNLAQQTGFLAALFYSIKILMAYGLFVFVVFGIVGVFYLYKKKKFEILVPFLIILPNFIYLINPNVSPDHPWMLRRFIFGIIPVTILYTVWFLDWFVKKRFVFYLLSVLLIFTNLLVFIPYLTVSPNKGLLPQVKEISDNFTDSDLILVDQLATGDGWSMMTGPLNFLYGKQAVYFFNPKDISKIDVSKFRNVYLIIPNNSLALYAKSGLTNHLVPIKKFEINNDILDAGLINKTEAYKLPIILPTVQKVTIDGKIYIYRK